jgi:hypothetical protein
LETKLQVLQDGVNKKIEGLGPLFNTALNFVINNHAKIKTQASMLDISSLCIEQVVLLGYKPAKTAIWDLFLVESNTKIRVASLGALAVLANDDKQIIESMNKWLTAQNDIFKTTKTQDVQVITTCIEALGKIGDSSSFTPILVASLTDYLDTVVKAADAALHTLKGDLKDNYIIVLNNGKFEEKRFSLQKAFSDSRLNDSEKCLVANAALKVALNVLIETPQDKEIARDIRNKSVLFLADKNYNEAADLGIMHFKRSLDEYDHKVSTMLYLVNSIKALGSLKSHQSAVVLKDYLDSINLLVENGKGYDEAIVLEVITSLKSLGDKIARSTLLYVGYIKYSQKVKAAAEDAFKNLR